MGLVSEVRRNRTSFNDSSIYKLLIFIVLSTVLHLTGFVFTSSGSKNIRPEGKNRVTVRVVKKMRNKTKDKSKKIVETKLEETEAPENADYKGYQNHKTEKQTKVKKVLNTEKALDPGQGGQSQLAKKPKKRGKNKASISRKAFQKSVKSDRLKPKFNKGIYSALLPSSSELGGELTKGYQDHIEDDLADGDRVDINTSDYRYISYFTSMRKSIELVWNYPANAVRRRQQGKVGLQFTIFKNGSVSNVKVLDSSGYSSLDSAIVEAIKLSSPFSPLPDGFGKSRMTITGTFRYSLSSSYVH